MSGIGCHMWELQHSVALSTTAATCFGCCARALSRKLRSMPRHCHVHPAEPGTAARGAQCLHCVGADTPAGGWTCPAGTEQVLQRPQASSSHSTFPPLAAFACIIDQETEQVQLQLALPAPDHLEFHPGTAAKRRKNGRLVCTIIGRTSTVALGTISTR